MTFRRLHRMAVVLAVLGVAIAGYLTWVHYAGVEPLCAGGAGGCERVQSSPYADLAGIPVALLGLAGYVAILVALLAPGEAARLVGAGLALAGMAFSAYLVYLQLAVIDAICQWCIASDLLMAALAVVAVARVLTAPAAHAVPPSVAPRAQRHGTESRAGASGGTR
jgi:uncharacterized membrane protein